MSRLIAVATAVVTLAVVANTPSRAGQPASPVLGTVPAFIRLVGSHAGVPDVPGGQFLVVVRDFANNPVPNLNVVVDFSGCADVRIASDQLNPATIVDCAARTVGAFTDATGTATFTVLGSSTGPAQSGFNCARVFAEGIQLAAPTVATFDLDGANGVSIGDLSVWLSDLGSGTYHGRADYDGNAMMGIGDLSVWLAELGSNRSTASPPACP
jgi:pimeloyl-ACP methyl ester carboxylesterase